jgi:hypothetical protein
MTATNMSNCFLGSDSPSSSAHAARVIPTNASRQVLAGPDIDPPADLVEASRPLMARRASASIDDHYLNFVLPGNSSNAHFPSRRDIVAALSGIFYRQIQRLGNQIDRSLAEIHHGDEEMSHEAEQRLALLMYVLGEPGLYEAKRVVDTRSPGNDDCDTMIKLIARSASPDSMKDVIRILARYLSSNNARIRYSATEALSQLGSKEATDALKQAVAGESNANVKRLMEAALRNR